MAKRKKFEERLIQSINNHLRELAQDLLRFQSREEIIHHLSLRFNETIQADFIAIGRVNGEQMVLEYDNGFPDVDQLFPYPVKYIRPQMKKVGVRYSDYEIIEDSPLKSFFDQHGIKSWFTIPLLSEDTFTGLCIIGFKESRVLYDEIGRELQSFGEDLALALYHIDQKKHNHHHLQSLANLTETLRTDLTLEDIGNQLTKTISESLESENVLIYLYDSQSSCFRLLVQQDPDRDSQELIEIDPEADLSNYWHPINLPGYPTTCLPLFSNTELIGVLIMERSDRQYISREDLDFLQVYSKYFVSLYQNLKLRKQESRQRRRLEQILQIEQQLIESSIVEKDFQSLLKELNAEINLSLILMDKFFNYLGSSLAEGLDLTLDGIQAGVQAIKQDRSLTLQPFSVTIEQVAFTVYPVAMAREIYGFVAIMDDQKYDDQISELQVRLLQNIFAFQFIKQQIERDSLGRLEEYFIDELLSGKKSNLKTTIEYASSFNLDLYYPHLLAVLDIHKKQHSQENRLTDRQEQNYLLELIRGFLKSQKQVEWVAQYKERLVIFVRQDRFYTDSFWEQVKLDLKSHLAAHLDQYLFTIGVGNLSNQPSDYLNAYREASQASHLLASSQQESTYQFYNQLGSYILLDQLAHQDITQTFLSRTIMDIYDYSNKHSTDLFTTLRVFLENNGKIQDSADALFIHRSSLIYRLKKIQDRLQIDLEDPQDRFNLMLAYRLFDLSGPMDED
ncbi:helix-turn-helix domain-containing protein [Hutsoniella sourekii]|uniref:helix-turn-helix domain-containing protein n=1 Tax=Hutsoniella sourekii TaxID=87650 RepID=UPI00047FFF64|nr:helix-turn-helix domain-containing protein [Hutsoniella sourekii]